MSQKSESETKKMFIRHLWHFPQYFDTSLKLLLFVTKFNRAKLVVFAFSDYNFVEYSNNLPRLPFLGCMVRMGALEKIKLRTFIYLDHLFLELELLHSSFDINLLNIPFGR